MDEDLPPTPTNVVELANDQYKYLTIKCSDLKEQPIIFFECLSGRFNYVFYSNTILIQDLFLGKEM
jgi:hypothetical protein